MYPTWGYFYVWKNKIDPVLEGKPVSDLWIQEKGKIQDNRIFEFPWIVACG